MATQTAPSCPPRPSLAVSVCHTRWLLLCASTVIFLSGCALREAIRDPQPPTPIITQLGAGQFVVCVKAAAGASFNPLRARLALGEAYGPIFHELRWTHPTLWARPPIIEVDCPNAPVLLQPGVVVSKGPLNSVRIVRDELLDQAATRHLRYYFVLPASEIERLFFGPSYTPGHRNQVQDVHCSPSPPRGLVSPFGGPEPAEVRRPACTPVSIGTYLTADEIEDSRVMMPAVRYLHGVGR